MRPPPCFRMCGAAACAQRNAARRSTFSTASHSDAVSSANGRSTYTDAMLIRNVEPAEGVGGLRDERLAGLRFRQVGLEGRGAPVGGPHALGRPLRLGARPRVAQRDVDAPRRQLAGDDQPDALAAGDERDFVSEVHISLFITKSRS